MAGSRVGLGIGRALILAAAAAPCVLATVIVVAFAAAELAGLRPLTMQPQNMAESAGIGSAAETLRRLRAGEDPTRVVDVRPDVISSSRMRLSPLEAAVFSRKVELVRLLDEQGAIVGQQQRVFLLCLADEIDAGDIVEYLSADAPQTCQPDTARMSIERRSGS